MFNQERKKMCETFKLDESSQEKLFKLFLSMEPGVKKLFSTGEILKMHERDDYYLRLKVKFSFYEDKGLKKRLFTMTTSRGQTGEMEDL